MNREFLETIRIEDTKVFNIAYHQKRYEAALASLGVFEVKNLIDEIKPLDSGLLRCRIIYSKNSFSITFHRYIKRKIQRLKLICDDTLEYAFKYADRTAIDALYSKRGSADDVLLVQKGLITDTTVANIALFDGEKWLTPRRALLKGTTRSRLLEEEKIVEADISVDDLHNFSKCALLNAMIDFDIIASNNLEELFC